MAGYNVEGVVLKTQPLGEADRLVTTYTRQRGRHRAVARGARRPRSSLGACLQPFVYAELHCWRSRSLDGISQCSVRQGFGPLRSSLSGGAAAAYMGELIDAFAREDDPEPGVFALLLVGLDGLSTVVADHGGEVPVAWPQDGPLERLLLSFQWKLLTLKGFRPILDRCAACGRGPQGGVLPAAVYFSPGEGGLLCQACRGTVEGPRRQVPRAAVTAINQLIAEPVAAAVHLTVPAPAGAALLRLSNDFLTWVLERPLRAAEFLAVLAAGDK